MTSDLENLITGLLTSMHRNLADAVEYGDRDSEKAATTCLYDMRCLGVQAVSCQIVPAPPDPSRAARQVLIYTATTPDGELVYQTKAGLETAIAIYTHMRGTTIPNAPALTRDVFESATYALAPVAINAVNGRLRPASEYESAMKRIRRLACALTKLGEPPAIMVTGEYDGTLHVHLTAGRYGEHWSYLSRTQVRAIIATVNGAMRDENGPEVALSDLRWGDKGKVWA